MRTTIDFEPLFDLSPDLIAIFGERGELLRVNASFQRDLGLEAGTLAGKPFTSLLHRDDVAAANTHFQHLADDSHIGRIENRIRLADGSYRRVRWQTSRDPAGTLFAVGHLLEDVLASADSSYPSGDLLRDLANHVSDFLWVREADSGRILYSNDVWERITGHRVPVGAHFREFFVSTHPEDVDRAKQAGRDSATQGGYDELLRAIDTKGEIRWMRVRTFPVYDEAGKVHRVVGIAEEVTQLKRTEEALRLSEQRFRSLLERSSDLIMLMDADARLTYLSPSFEVTLGYSVKDWLNRSGLELLWPDDLDDAHTVLGRILDAPGVSTTWQLRVHHADGTWRWLEGTSVNHLEDPAINGIVVNCRDVTERKRMEAQFTQAQKMESIGRLAGGVAHDFNNLLTAIKGNMSLALMEVKPIDPLYEYLIGVDKAADSAASLTRQLLAFSRKQIINPKVINLNDVLKHVQQLLARLIGEDIHLEQFAAPDLQPIRFDANQAEQILINLAVNARDAMPHGGHLMLETGNVDLDEEYARNHPYVTPGQYVMLAVSDTGVGMKEEVRAHLFEPFFTTKPAGSGTGLGLAMVYGAVKQNRGHIEVYSEPGHGATFKIYLPAVNERPEKAIEPKVEWRPRGVEIIVLVEDEEHVRTMATILLKRQGYTVHAFADGPSAIAAVESMTETPHLLITDVVMPKMNGQVLTQRLTEMRPEIKVLFTSGYTANVIVHHGVLKEGVEFLAKPYSVDLLARRVREVLDKPRP